MADALKLPFAGEEVVRALARVNDEPDWLLADRLAALAAYSDLPVEGNPLFTLYVDLRGARWAEIDPFGETGDASEVAATVPEGAAALIEIADDRVVARALSQEARAAGVVVDTFANVLRERPQLLREAIDGGTSLPADDKFAQFARGHAALGLLVHVPRSVALARPIVLRWRAASPGRGLVSRTVISLADNASATILEEQLPSSGGAATQEVQGQSLWWGTTEVDLGRGASLSFAGQQDFGPQTLAIVNRHATIGQDAHLRWALASVGAELHKSRIDNRLVGRGASVSQVEIGFGSGRQLFDLTSYTRHVGADTTGDLLSKGVFLDRARGYFKGMIAIERSATGTDSFLGEFAMLLAKSARSVTIPSLEIDQPDVRRASHSSSVGPIDETEIFYLMSRGLPREVARKFIVLGFLEPVVARIPLTEAQERLRHLLERKWPSSTDARAALNTPLRRVRVAASDDIPTGTMLMVQVDGTDILLVNLDGAIRAMQGVCSHEYFELDKGFLTGSSLTCALHLSRFDLETGEALDPPAEAPLQMYPVIVEDGQVVLELPEGKIPVNE